MIVHQPDKTAVVASNQRIAHVIDVDNDEGQEDDDDRPDHVELLTVAASFDEMVVWGHEILPASDDTFVKGIEEWIALAETVSLFTRNRKPAWSLIRTDSRCVRTEKVTASKLNLRQRPQYHTE